MTTPNEPRYIDRWTAPDADGVERAYWRTNILQKPLFEAGEPIEIRGVGFVITEVSEYGLRLETPTGSFGVLRPLSLTNQPQIDGVKEQHVVTLDTADPD